MVSLKPLKLLKLLKRLKPGGWLATVMMRLSSLNRGGINEGIMRLLAIRWVLWQQRPNEIYE